MRMLPSRSPEINSVLIGRSERIQIRWGTDTMVHRKDKVASLAQDRQSRSQDGPLTLCICSRRTGALELRGSSGLEEQSERQVL